jgi:AI-2 transport protein TqsA
MKKWEYLNHVCLITLTAIALTAALVFTRPVLMPFTVSLFAYSVLSPLVKGIENVARLHRALALILTVLIFMMVFGTLITFVGHSLEDFFHSADAYGEKVIVFGKELTETLKSYGINLDWSMIQDMIKKIPIFHMAGNFSGVVLSIITNSFFVAIFVLFLLVGESQGPKNSSELIKKIKSQIGRYAMTKFTTSVSTGVIIGVVLGIFKVDLAFMFAIITILLNFIPSVGSILATIIVIPVLLLQFGLGWKFYVIIAFCGFVQFLIGNVVEPKVMGKSLNLHPITIMLFLMFWGLIWGVPGMFLAVPITAVLKIILSKIETTKGLADLLSGELRLP